MILAFSSMKKKAREAKMDYEKYKEKIDGKMRKNDSNLETSRESSYDKE